jgi:DnaJ-domain-containing protein 1
MAGEEAARRAAEEEQRRQAEYRRGQEEEAGRRKNERQGTNREQDRQDGTKVPRDSTRTDPYAVLGLRPGATKDEIRAAYRNLIAKYHPDKVAHLGIEFQEIAKTKALELNRAYEILHR